MRTRRAFVAIIVAIVFGLCLPARAWAAGCTGTGNCFWVGGTGNWNASRWAASSGGSASTNVPGSGDNCNFDSASSAGAYTVTVNTATRFCKDFTANGGSSHKLTLVVNVALAVFGSWTSSSTSMADVTGAVASPALWEGASNTIASGGIAWTGFTGTTWNFDTGTGYTLSDAASIGRIDLSGTSFSTGGNALTATIVSFNAGTLTLGASTVAVSLTWSATAGGTLSAGTSTINMAGSNFAGGGYAYNNVVDTSPASSGYSLDFTDSSAFASFSVASPPNTVTFAAGTTQTITRLPLRGSSGNLITIKSATGGSATSLACTAGPIICDFLSVKDITMTAASTKAVFFGSQSTNTSGNTGSHFYGPAASEGGGATYDSGAYAVARGRPSVAGAGVVVGLVAWLAAQRRRKAA